MMMDIDDSKSSGNGTEAFLASVEMMMMMMMIIIIIIIIIFKV
jgi:hypothetical protein